MGGIHLQKKELVWFFCFYIFLLPQTMLPSYDQIANQSCSSEQQQMATLFGVVEKYTHNQFQLSESVPLGCWIDDAMPPLINSTLDFPPSSVFLRQSHVVGLPNGSHLISCMPPPPLFCVPLRSLKSASGEIARGPTREREREGGRKTER